MKAFAVTGTVVEDTILTADGTRTEDLGGILYAISSLSAVLPEGMVAQPVLGVGRDALSHTRERLRELSRVETEGLIAVDAVNNKVCIEYSDETTRTETLTGGVPPLAFEAFAPWLERVDAWLWNFISGMEVERRDFDRIKKAFGGPVYLDLHSLCLDHGHGGARRHRRPRDWEGWVRGVSWLQVNGEEAGLLLRDEPRPLDPGAEGELAGRVHALGVSGLLVTRGANGAAWYGADGTSASRPGVRAGQAVDPTGCGDVFGAVWLALHLGHGLAPAEALEGAVEAAGVAATVRGTRGLRAALAAVSV